jgi:REP element-mobilizing transposase RayT
MTIHPADDETYTRRDSLRLRGFDYTSRRVYFATVVAAERRRVFLDRRLSDAVIECLSALRQKMGFYVYVYCLMPDHLHALIGLGESGRSLGEVCGAFKSLSTRAYWHWYEGKLWQRQYFDHIIRNEEDFFECLEYIKMNPVRKNLVEQWGQWPYTGRMDYLK